MRILKTTAGLALLGLVLAAGCDDGGLNKVTGQIDVPVREYDLGEIPVLNHATQVVELHNIGRAPLVVESVSLAEEGTPFTVAELTTNEIPSGDVMKVTVTFTPPEQKDYAATLVVKSDDPNEPEISLKLSGRGSTVGKMEYDPRLDFLLVCEGAGDVKRVKISSTGTADLIIEDVHFKEGTAAEFTFVSSTKTPATVEKGKDMLLSIKYLPVETSTDESDGVLVVTSTDPEKRTVEIPLHGKVNRAPVAAIKDIANASPGATITLDGAGSMDPDNHTPLQFAWTLKTSPIGSKAKPNPLDTPQSQLALDLPGAYTVQLKVKDALGCFSKPVFKDILARPAEQLVVEVVWNNPDTDIDLHMVPDGSNWFESKDCYYADTHRAPDWGIVGDASDDPLLSRDALVGFGPEVVSYKAPAKGKYWVMANFFSDHGSKNPSTEVTLRVYEFGVVRSETKKTMPRVGQSWVAVTIEWPSGKITPVDQLQ